MEEAMNVDLDNVKHEEALENALTLEKNETMPFPVDNVEDIRENACDEQVSSDNSIEIIEDSTLNDVNSNVTQNDQNELNNQIDEASNHDSNIHASDSPSQVQENTGLKSLGIIALEYGDYSDVEDIEADTNESMIAIPITQTQSLQQYRMTEVIEVSSGEESDSEDDSSTGSSSSSSNSRGNDSSNSDDENTVNTNINRPIKKNTARNRMQQEEQSELNNLPPIEDLKISVDEVLCDPLGKVYKVVEQVVVVKPIPNKPTLNLDTVLFVDKGRKALGKILDVYGPVNEPYYCVRFNTPEHIKECGIVLDMIVYYSPNMSCTSILFPHELRNIKHSDTIGDDETPVFSDDEEEQKYQMTQKDKNNASQDNTSQKSQPVLNARKKWKCQRQSNNPWNKNAQWQGQQSDQEDCANVYGNPNEQNEQQQYAFAHSRPQYPFQNNSFHGQETWQPIPRNAHPMFDRSCNRYRAPYKRWHNTSQHWRYPSFQRNNTTPQYPRIPFGSPASFYPSFPSYPGMGYYPPHAANARFPCASTSSHLVHMQQPSTSMLDMNTATWPHESTSTSSSSLADTSAVKNEDPQLEDCILVRK